MATVKLEIASGKATGTNSNMPLLITPSVITNLGTLTLAEAQSCRIYTDAGLTTEIAREVVGADEIHCKVTSVSSSTELWFDYDGVRSDYAVTDTYGRNAVWSDYRAVWHMNDVTTSSFGDSTSGGFTANKRAANEPQVITGKIGAAQDFDGSNDFANIAHNATLSPTSNMTIQMWARSAAQLGHMVGKDNETNFRREGWIMFANASGASVNFSFTVGLNSGYPQVVSTNQATNTWLMLHGTYIPSTELRIYVNGSSNNVSTASIPASIAAVTRELNFGRRNNGFGPDRFYNGDLDEVRLRASTLSADWITTEYQNQNDNGAFWVATPVGGATPRGGILLSW